MLAITTSNPFHRMISHVLTTPKQLFLSNCVRKIERVSSYGSLAFSSLASILHIATVAFAIVAVSTGPMFVAVVLTGTALAGTGIILAITAIALRQTHFFKRNPLNSRQNQKNNGHLRPSLGMPSNSNQRSSLVPSIKLSSASATTDQEVKRKKSPRTSDLNTVSLNQLFAELKKKDLKKDKLKKENSDLKKEMQIVKKERSEAQDECKHLENKNQALENHINIVRKLNTEASMEKAKLQKKVKQLEAELAKHEMETGWTTVPESPEKTDPSSAPNPGKDTKS